MLDVLRRIPGVGRVSNIGSRYYAMQIWVQPDKLANFGLTVQDVQNALKDQNRESAAGVLGQQPIEGLDITIPISTKGRLSTVSQFEEIVLRADADGSLIRLRDVARISLEAQSYNTESGINGGQRRRTRYLHAAGSECHGSGRKCEESHGRNQQELSGRTEI